MKTARMIRRLQKGSDEKFVAAGKFVSGGGTIGRSRIEIPHIAFVGVTDSEIVLIKGTSKMMMGPWRPRQVLARWRRSEVKVVPKRGMVNRMAEFHVPGFDRPIGLEHGRLDASAKNVVLLLSSHDHAHDRLSPVDVD